MNWKLLFFIGLVAYGGYNHWQKRAVTYGPGAVAITEPVQRGAASDDTISKNGYQLTPLQDFSIEARVLSTEHYNMDRESQLAPVDLALGWGRMSDESILSQIKISQSNRFYFWHVDAFPIPREEIETHSANMHMIPADSSVEKTLKSVRVGQVVTISGQLVEAKAPDGWHWRSSLTRKDTGNGACEVVLVKSIYVK
ncbi:MAG TPA: hypothetical protein VK974_01340 [Methylophilaceae bacterium]|nr:hypothetical protein [Methylophilaceae bacterium]